MINGGFGLVLDGTEDAEQKARRVLSWDVANGVSDRQHPPRLSPVQTADPPPSGKVCSPPAAAVSPPATARVALHGRQPALHPGCVLSSLCPWGLGSAPFPTLRLCASESTAAHARVCPDAVCGAGPHPRGTTYQGPKGEA